MDVCAALGLRQAPCPPGLSKRQRLRTGSPRSHETLRSAGGPPYSRSYSPCLPPSSLVPVVPLWGVYTCAGDRCDAKLSALSRLDGAPQLYYAPARAPHKRRLARSRCEYALEEPLETPSHALTAQ